MRSAELVVGHGARLICLAMGLQAIAAGQPAIAGATATDSCADYRVAAPARQRLSDGNRARLEAAQALVAPRFSARGAASGLQMLADYQEEMEQVRPDRQTAALYLASVSTVPVTLELLQVVNSTLCVAASPATATAVATLAEASRIEMAR